MDSAKKNVERVKKLSHAALSLNRQLKKNQETLVLAESCTAGLLAALIAETPGASNHFVGSQVVYQNEAKRRWLGVRAKTLQAHSAVSQQVAEEMVHGVLKKTPGASIAAAITGYLGPTGEKVGKVFVSVLKRKDPTPISFEIDLEVSPQISRSRLKARDRRRELAALSLLLALRSVLDRRVRN